MAADRSAAGRAIAIRVTGRVQGVGYRHFTCMEATRLGLRGWVVNCEDGAVEMAVHGAGPALGQFVEVCRKGPEAASVENLDVRSVDAALVDEPPSGARRF